VPEKPQEATGMGGVGMKDEVVVPDEGELVRAGDESKVIGNFVLLFRSSIVGLYTNNEFIASITTRILLIYVIFLAFDGLRIIGLAIMRAYNLNRLAAKFAFYSYWGVGFCSGIILSKFYGIYGYWMGLVLCFITITYFFYSKIYHGFIEKPRVKEKLVYNF